MMNNAIAQRVLPAGGISAGGINPVAPLAQPVPMAQPAPIVPPIQSRLARPVTGLRPMQAGVPGLTQSPALNNFIARRLGMM